MFSFYCLTKSIYKCYFSWWKDERRATDLWAHAFEWTYVLSVDRAHNTYTHTRIQLKVEMDRKWLIKSRRFRLLCIFSLSLFSLLLLLLLCFILWLFFFFFQFFRSFFVALVFFALKARYFEYAIDSKTQFRLAQTQKVGAREKELSPRTSGI